MNHKNINLNSLWGELIVEELWRNNVDMFVLSPGSRCTPLTTAVAGHSKVKNVRHFDERGAAFFALGYGRATGKAAVLICTSGTAVANYFPAVIEASMDRIPLILLTADRPPELHDGGANQTIDQVNIFGKYVRYYFDLPCPDINIPPEFLLTTIDNAIYQAINSPEGPVHINCRFREPLVAVSPPESFKSYLYSCQYWLNNKEPYTQYKKPDKVITKNQVEQLTHILNNTTNGLLMVGKLKDSTQQKAVSELAQKLNWPVFADIQSGLRGNEGVENTIQYFDQLLLSEKFQKVKNLTVVHIGGMITSKRANFFLQQNKLKDYIYITDHPWRNDPNHKVTVRIEADIDCLCYKLLLLVNSKKNNRLLTQLKRADQKADKIIEKAITSTTSLSEIAVVRLVSKYIEKGHKLFLSNSMPIRDMDMYANPSHALSDVAANRGVSGIDGVIATFGGYVYGASSGGTLIIGDLAFLHDLNSLALLKNITKPLTVVLINNNGGGIFSFLPISAYKNIFEPFFGTPHNLTFRKVVSMFGGDYYQPHSQGDFITNYSQTQRAKCFSVIEVQTERRQNLKEHLSLQKKIKNAVDKL
ncbi:MAG: 2-succinyl-5-enolpyruvyl-6-hydroxy-3-cyclohexene-1-carboxylic-acid synthase [FCB group bacterium]|nr:2-succinyl-5-enolpyruvyl-6-hydroxy-3-cyclohexene-1-carboxylic-acid synthase [FCB group bacterium]